jgi:hypothetical protein
MSSYKPEETTTLEDFVAAGEDVSITYHKLSLVEDCEGIKFPIQNILDDYEDELESVCKSVELSDEQASKYKYKPKLLAYDIYGNPELYFIILMVNGICNMKEFTLENKVVKLISKRVLSEVLRQIYKSEKSQIELYNEKENSEEE